MDIQALLRERGLSLPTAPKPVAAYLPAVHSGNMLYVSGQLPMLDGKLLATGPVGSKVSPPDAQAAARQCVLNALAIVDDVIGGDWSRFVRVVRLGVFVASDADFTGQPAVANGASEQLVELFGETGRHARAAVGVNVLPLNATVEVEMTVELR